MSTLKHKAHTVLVASAIVVTLLAVGGPLAQESTQPPENPSKILVIAEDENGKVWANLSLTVQRTGEPYLPMVVAVENQHSKPVTFTRESFWLNDLDDIVYVMPSIKEMRKNYERSVMDSRTVSFAGIPWESWRWNRRLEPSNFFPNLRSTRGNTVMDRVTLRQRHALADLMYFESPRNLGEGRPLFLNVRPTKGWKAPIRIRFVISP
jgi:hypothetical protein